jgi:hypothetical protein
MKPNEDVCGCGGKGIASGGFGQIGEARRDGDNRPLYQLANLIAMLERQEEQRRQAETKGGD